MDGKMTFERALASLISNPFQTIATFIFADDKPNDNRQGLPFSEFERVAASAIGMPVKMRFTGYGVGNHPGSIPIGVIQGMDTVTISDTHHQLVAKAALWNDEFPEEIEWLKQAYAEGKAPGISYEINYHDVAKDDTGTEWFQGTYTGAATFVRSPSYGTRTALLALASTQDKTEVEQGIIALAGQLSKKTKGGNQMDEKELEALKAKAAEAETYKAEAGSKQSEIEKLLADLQERDTSISTLETENLGLKQAALVESRVRKYTEAGFALETEAEKAEKKKTLLASFSDEQFDEYVADLVAVKSAAAPAPAAGAGNLALASLRKDVVPKFDPATDTNYQTLKAGMRSLARPNSIE